MDHVTGRQLEPYGSAHGHLEHLVESPVRVFERPAPLARVDADRERVGRRDGLVEEELRPFDEEPPREEQVADAIVGNGTVR